MVSAIVNSPEFGEVCFLIALIIFAVAVVVHATEAAFNYVGVLIPAGLAFLALGFLAL